MRESWRVVFRRTLPVVVVLALAGCGGASRPAAAPSPSFSALPADPLARLVPQPGEVPEGLYLVAAQSGPADAAKLAGFAGSAAAATRARLAAEGFRSAYVAEYASRAGRTLTVVVARFASVAGATGDLTADLAGTTEQPDIGDADGELIQALPGGPAGGQLDTERFRVGSLTYLVAVGGPQGVDISDVRAVSRQLAERGATA